MTVPCLRSRLCQLAAACALLGLGCAPHLDPVSGTLPAAATADAGGGLAAALRRVDVGRARRAPALAPCIAAVVEDSSGARGLEVYDALSGQLRFRSSFEPTTRPVVTADLVLTSDRDELVALTASDGSERFRFELPLPELVAVAGDESTVVATVRDPASEHTAVLGLDRVSGGLLFEHRFPYAMGTPAMLGGVLALPLQGQTLALLDSRSGALLTELRSEDDLITWAQGSPEGLRFGHRRVYTLRAGYDGTHDSLPTLQPPAEQLPGSPLPFPSVSAAVPATRSAHGRVGAYPVPGEADGGWTYGIFYRHVYLLDADGSVRWAAQLPADAVQAIATTTSLLILDEQGTLTELAMRSGAAHPRLRLAARVLSASMSQAGAGWATGAGRDEPARSPVDGRSALLAIVADKDARLYPSRRFALRALVADPKPGLATELLELYEDAGPLQPDLTAALSRLQDGEGELLAALEQRQDALTPHAHPPFAAVAEVLAARGVRAAAPLMAARMLDYQTPLPDVPRLAAALLRLAPEFAGDSIEAFLGRYRMDSSIAPYPEVWLEVAALWLAYGEAGHPPAALSRWAYSEHTPAALRDSLRERLELLAAKPAEPPVPGPAGREERPGASDVEDDLAPRLLPASVSATFAPQEERLRDCLREVNRTQQKDFQQFRITMLVSSLGASDTRYYAPALESLRACVDPIVHGLRFEVTRSQRQLVNHVVRLQRESDIDDPALFEQKEKPWWAPYAELASPDKVATLAPIAPWWRNRNPAMEPVQPGYGPQPAEATSTASAPSPEQRSAPASDSSHDRWWEPSP